MEERAFERAVQSLLPRLRGYVARLVANPSDADDLVQDTLARATATHDSLRDPAAFRTWLFRIATHLCLDHLRRKSRWRHDAQFDGASHFLATPALMLRLHGATLAPDFRYDFREHIAYCFTCVGRSLPPEQQAALLLGEVFGFSGREAARCLGVSESIYRHHLADARSHMRSTYDNRCALVRKQGACYQCSALREECPSERRGDAPVPLAGDTSEQRFVTRLRIVADADLTAGSTADLHRLLLTVLDERQQGRAKD